MSMPSGPCHCIPRAVTKVFRGRRELPVTHTSHTSHPLLLSRLTCLHPSRMPQIGLPGGLHRVQYAVQESLNKQSKSHAAVGSMLTCGLEIIRARHIINER